MMNLTKASRATIDLVHQHKLTSDELLGITLAFISRFGLKDKFDSYLFKAVKNLRGL